MHNATLNETDVPIEDPFAETGETVEPIEGYANILHVGEAMGSIQIPSIGLETPIYHGVGEEVLSRGIGHMSNTSLPVGGKGTHTALTGHRGLPSAKLFRHLDEVDIGDLFHIDTLDERLTYKVDQIEVVHPTDLHWLTIEEDHDYATLITCEPYMINTHRLLVRGERVTEEEIEQMSEQSRGYNQKKRNPFFIGGVIFLIITGSTYGIIRYKRQ